MPATKRRRGTAIVELEHNGVRGVLMMSDGGPWMLPGGGADLPSETRFAAAIRELQEETGLRAKLAVELFEHESSNRHRVCYIAATGKPHIRDPKEAKILGLYQPNGSVVPIATLPGAVPPKSCTPGSRTILKRFATYRAERPAFFGSLACYNEPESSLAGPVPERTVPHQQIAMGEAIPPQVPASEPAPEPDFELLDSLTIQHGPTKHTIAIYRGDLTALPPAEAVDVLIVSALPNAYQPTRRSLIGALDRRGISVAALAADKEEDLRPTLACWLSKPLAALDDALPFKRILCFEPQQRGAPEEVVGDIFQCLSALASTEPIRSIAMPILAGGVQGVSTVEMVMPLFEAATHWLERGLSIETIKIVAYSDISAAELRGAFGVLKSQYTPPSMPVSTKFTYDLFISYCWANRDDVDFLVNELKRQRPGVRIFLDRLNLKLGCAWQQEIFEALDACAKIVTVYSPEYLTSKVCREEFNIARLRQREEQGEVMVPVYLRSAELPSYMKLVQYIDCREGDRDRLQQAAIAILGRL